MGLTVRPEVIEYGALPNAPWLSQIGEAQGVSAIRAVLQQMLQLATYDDRGRAFVTPQAIASILGSSPVQTKVLVDLLAGVVDPADLVQRTDGGEEAVGVEAHALALYLLAQVYMREAAKVETADVWPSEFFAWQQEPSSPMRMIARSWGRDGQGSPDSHAHRAHLPAVRQHLRQHMALMEALVAGFGAYLATHASSLVALAASGPASPAKAQPQGLISAAELDRLGFLLRPAVEDAGAAAVSEGEEGGPGSSAGAAAALPQRRRRALEGGSPMDVCNTPFSEEAAALSEHTPFFAGGGGEESYAPQDAVAAWLAECLRPAEDAAVGGGSSSEPMVGVQQGGSPRREPPLFNQLVGAAGSGLAAEGDVQGVHRATVLRGEEECPSGQLRVLDCHDSVVYVLAPLQYALVAACSDCVVVLGAVGRSVRLERCERVQVVAACRALTINTCHDCIVYAGVNQRPVLLGDNRFLQLAPYNAGYERLAAHMALAGVAPTPNLWDQPLALLPDHRAHHHEQLRSPQPPSSPMAGASTPPGPHLQPPGSPGWRRQQQQREEQQDEEEPMQTSQQPPSPSQQQQQQQQEQQPPQTPPPAQQQPGSPNMRRSPSPPQWGGAAGSPRAAAVAEQCRSPLAGAPPSATLLPPAKLTPFVVPFWGGTGPLCGGPAPSSASARVSSPGDSLSSFMSVGEGASAAFPSSPFPLPEEYGEAWRQRMTGAAEVRAAVKAAGLGDEQKRALMAAIQSHFKEWLQQTGAMRQVYDLAKLERDAEAGGSGGGAPGSPGAGGIGGLGTD